MPSSRATVYRILALSVLNLCCLFAHRALIRMRHVRNAWVHCVVSCSSTLNGVGCGIAISRSVAVRLLLLLLAFTKASALKLSATA
jgi:hypothetical protein